MIWRSFKQVLLAANFAGILQKALCSSIGPCWRAKYSNLHDFEI